VINCGTISAIDNINPTTLIGWIFPNDFGEGDKGRIYYRDAGTFMWGVWIRGTDSDNLLKYQRNFSTTNGKWQTPTSSISTSVWQHLAITYDNSDVSNDPVIYLDGVSQTITETTAPVGSAADDSGVALLLGNNDDGSRTFNGRLAEMAIYNMALSAAEVLALAHSINPLHIRRTNLKAYWPLPGNSSPEADLSGNGNNGTVTGAIKGAHPPITPYDTPFSPRTVA